MAGKIPQAFIDDLLSQTNIVTLVRERITLKKAGSDYHACCPFHDEKTPSFTVSERKQFFYCFGCGASGNAVKFIMDYDRLDFITALESLANQAGMTIPRDDRQDQNYAVYYRLMQHCQNHYRTQLQLPPAQQFLNQRQISVAIAETFQIGFAADAWRQCLESANQQKFSTQQCLDVGLVTHGENKARNRPYDRFRARVMFPIRDERGRTIAFGGRAMGDHKPKYLNSPESKIFHKRKVLYGLYEAKQAHKKLTELIVVEGYMDVVALACHGVQNAVATLGTAITEQHLSNLFKHCQRVTFCFDGDNAGRKAAWRACETSLSMMHDGREVRFLFLPEKEDPDSLINQQGREAFMALLDHAEPLADFFFEACLKTHPVDTLAGRAGLAKTVQSYLAKLPTGIYKNLMQQKCSSLVQLPVEQMASPSPMPQPPHSDNPQVKTEPNNQEPSPKPTRATLKAIYLLLNFPALAKKLPAESLQHLGIDTQPLFSQLLVNIIDYGKQHPGTPHTAQLLAHLSDHPLYSRLVKLAARATLVAQDGALIELQAALKHRQLETIEEQIQQLLKKNQHDSLNTEEKSTLQRLISQKKDFKELNINSL